MIQAIIPILFAMVCDSTRYEPLEHPTPLFEQTELSVCLESGEDRKTYLKHVALYAPVNSPPFCAGRKWKKTSSGNSVSRETEAEGKTRP